jgi:hypothetical protein
MLLSLFVTCALLAAGWAKPVEDIQTRAKMYALLHPNTDVGQIEECTEFHAEGTQLLDGTIETNPLNAVLNPNLLWPNGVSYYTIQNGVYTSTELRQIEDGITDLQRLTQVNGRNCITILPRNNEANFIRVENYSGCSSFVGRVGGSQRMSLVPGCVVRHGTIMHEFIHAYGFYHEQSRYDRDDFVEINWSNIQPGTENNFNKYTPQQITHLGTPYDYGSVMHYGAYGFAIDPNVPTIITKDPNAVIGQRETLSRWDIERIQILYGCINPIDSVHFKHIKREDLFRV